MAILEPVCLIAKFEDTVITHATNPTTLMVALPLKEDSVSGSVVSTSTSTSSESESPSEIESQSQSQSELESNPSFKSFPMTTSCLSIEEVAKMNSELKQLLKKMQENTPKETVVPIQPQQPPQQQQQQAICQPKVLTKEQAARITLEIKSLLFQKKNSSSSLSSSLALCSSSPATQSIPVPKQKKRFQSNPNAVKTYFQHTSPSQKYYLDGYFNPFICFSQQYYFSYPYQKHPSNCGSYYSTLGYSFYQPSLNNYNTRISPIAIADEIKSILGI